MDTTVGFVYVLTNPSIPGQVKIGMTQKRPERRSAELSAATGVPEEFQVAFYRTFENAALAERVVHSVLDEQGLRVGKNREFFSISAQDAQTLIEEVAQRLDDEDSTEGFAEAFVTRAQALLDTPRPPLGDLEEALVLLEHATTLGDALAPYLGGDTAWELARRRKSKPEVVALLYSRGRGLFEMAGERGASRGFAQSARMALERDDTGRFIELWDRYLDALPADEPVPEGEMDFIIGLMYDEFFTGHKVRPLAHSYLKTHSKPLRDRVKEREGDAQFQRWLNDYLTTLEQRILERVRLPILIFGVLLVFFYLKPAWCIGAVAVLLLLFGLGRGMGKTARGIMKIRKK